MSSFPFIFSDTHCCHRVEATLSFQQLLCLPFPQQSSLYSLNQPRGRKEGQNVLIMHLNIHTQSDAIKIQR